MQEVEIVVHVTSEDSGAGKATLGPVAFFGKLELDVLSVYELLIRY